MKLDTFRLFICCAAILAFSFISLNFAQEEIPIPIVEIDDPEPDVEINSSDHVVRLIYLVPNDRQAQPFDIDQDCRDITRTMLKRLIPFVQPDCSHVNGDSLSGVTRYISV